MSSRFLKPFKFLSLISSREKKSYCCLSFASFWAVTLKGTNTYRTHEDFPNLHNTYIHLSIKPQTISLHLQPVSLQLPVSSSRPPASGFQPQASSFRLSVAILLLQASSLRPPTLYYIILCLQPQVSSSRPPASGFQPSGPSSLAPGLQLQASSTMPLVPGTSPWPKPSCPNF